MTRLARQIYFICIVLITVICIPVILLYVSGYRLNYRDFNITQTGSVSITTLPKYAKIKIDELDFNTSSPTIINQLIPGTYTVHIRDEGFTDWSDTIHIQAGATYQLENVVLFPTLPRPEPLQEIPNALLLDQPVLADLSPTLQKAIADLQVGSTYTLIIKGAPEITLLDQVNHHLYMLREDRQGNVEVTTLGEDVRGFQWDAETETLLYYSENEIFIYEYASEMSRSITRQSNAITDVIWHPRGGNIIIASQDSIWTLETRLTDRPNSTVLYVGTQPNDLIINSKGDQLYARDIINDEDSLFTLELLQ